MDAAQVRDNPRMGFRRVKELIQESDEKRAKLEGALRSFRVVHKRYFSDNGVELEAEVPLERLAELFSQERQATFSGAPSASLMACP